MKILSLFTHLCHSKPGMIFFFICATQMKTFWRTSQFFVCEVQCCWDIVQISSAVNFFGKIIDKVPITSWKFPLGHLNQRSFDSMPVLALEKLDSRCLPWCTAKEKIPIFTVLNNTKATETWTVTLNIVNAVVISQFTFTFNHLADAFIQSDVQMRRTIEAIRPSREQQYTSAMTSLS